MRIVFFCHSLRSDWNHGNAHFLRGVATELMNLGHEVRVFEPRDGWSLMNLRRDQGERPIEEFHRAYPRLRSDSYDLEELDLEVLLEGADLVLVHEWSDPVLVKRIGDLRKEGGFRLFFHDTHHRAVSAPEQLETYDLSNYDGALVFGEVLRELYLEKSWARAWTWHEAADIRVFRPIPETPRRLDLVWIGNWGDGERSRELQSFLIEPVRQLRLHACVYGVRYPQDALFALERSDIDYGGWVANFHVPELFATARCTVHVPRRFYVEQLPGIPTIRVFEALACGIPLVCAPWEDTESLFRAGTDFLVARDGKEMRDYLRLLRSDGAFAREMADHGVATIRARHTCAHRAQELLSIHAEVR